MTREERANQFLRANFYRAGSEEAALVEEAFLAGFDAGAAEVTVHVDSLKSEIDALRADLRNAMGHSNCYCKTCMMMAKLYWRPVEDDTRALPLDPKEAQDAE